MKFACHYRNSGYIAIKWFISFIILGISTQSFCQIEGFGTKVTGGKESWLSNLVNYSIEDGLPSSQIYGFATDDNGFLWMGTDNGLCFFDSEQTEVFTTDDGLPENVILELKKDRAGKLWGKTLSQHFFYIDPLTKKVTSISLKERLDSIHTGYRIDNWVIDRNFNLWVAVWVHIAPYSDEKSSKLYKLNHNNLLEWTSPEKSKAQFIVKRFGDQLLCAYERNLKFSETRFTLGSLADPNLLRIQTTLPPYPLSNRFEHALLSDSAILLSINEFLFRIEPSQQRVYGPYVFPGDIGELEEAPNGYVYVGLVDKKGLWQFSKSDHNFSNGYKYLPGITCSSLGFHNEGGMLLGTSNKGFYYQALSPFWAVNPPSKDGTVVTQLKSHQNRVFLLNGVSSIYETVLNEDQSWNYLEKVRYDNRIADFWVSDDGYYFAPANKPCVYNWTDQSTTKEKVPIHASQNSVPWYGGNVIGCLSNGFAITNYRTITRYRSVHKHLKPENLFLDRVRNALPLDTQCFLLATVTGAYKVKNLVVEPFIAKHISSTLRVNEIIRGIDSTVWLATHGKGVFVADLDQNLLGHFQEKDGLPQNRVSTLARVGNQMWIGTKNGLGLIDNIANLSSSRIRVFDKEDGLPSKEILHLAVYQSRWLIINTSAGLAILDTRHIPSTKTSFNLFERGVTVNDSDFQAGKNFSLASYHNDIRFSYGGKHYGVKSPVYWYRFLNRDSTWTHTGENELSFSNLASDPYKLQISSVPRFEKGKSLQYEFVIREPFTKTTLFFTLLALATLLVFIVTISIIYGRLKLRNQLVRSQQTALISQMNPHFIFNTLNSIQYYIGESGQSKAHQYLSHFSRLIRRVLDSSITGQIRLDEEIETLEQYVKLEKLRFEDRISAQFEVEPEVRQISSSTFIPSMVIQPFIENTIVHGLSTKAGGGALHVHFSYTDNELRISVKDDGVGRQASQKHKASQHGFKKKSIGTSNTLNRIKLLNKAQKANIRINITDVEPSGTLVDIRMQLP